MGVEVISALVTTAAIGIGAFVVRVLIRGLKTYLHEEIRSHLVPNGGSSLADRIAALEGAVAEIKETLICPDSGCPLHTGCAHSRPAVRRRGLAGLFGWRPVSTPGIRRA